MSDPLRDRARRTRRSFLTGGIAGFLGWGAWLLATNSRDEGGIPAVFRRVLELNGALWQRVISPLRLSPEKARQTGPARVNGDIGLQKPMDPANWKLKVEDSLFVLTLEDLRKLPRTEVSTEFKCIEGWKIDITYAGVRFSDFAEHYGLLRMWPYARIVGLATPDREYYVSLDLPSMLHPQTVLAYEMNGEPLTPEHGAPLRLVVPIKYGIKSLKRVGSLRFSAERLPDYWAEQGYDWHATL